MIKESVAGLAEKPMTLVAVAVAASVVLSAGLACATPIAAFALIAAALPLRMRDRFLFVLAVWACNQAIGFGLLGYPVEADSIAWGAIMGAAACASLLCARWMLANATGIQSARLPLALVASFAAYEAAIALAAFAIGGLETFTLPIVANLFALNAATALGALAIRALVSAEHRDDATPAPAAIEA